MSTPIWDELTGEQGDPTGTPGVDLAAEQADISRAFADLTGADGGAPTVFGDALAGDHEGVSA